MENIVCTEDFFTRMVGLLVSNVCMPMLLFPFAVLILLKNFFLKNSFS